MFIIFKKYLDFKVNNVNKIKLHYDFVIFKILNSLSALYFSRKFGLIKNNCEIYCLAFIIFKKHLDSKRNINEIKIRLNKALIIFKILT